MMSNTSEGDFKRNRLFFEANQAFGFYHPKVAALKGHIFLVESLGASWVIKGYDDEERALRQLNIAKALKQEGFSKGLTYQRFPSGKYIVYGQGLYWLCMEQLQKRREVHFRSSKDRQGVSELLHRFHKEARQIQSLDLPAYALLSHWERRFDRFTKSHSLSQFNEALGGHTTKALLKAGDEALDRLQKEPLREMEKKAVRQKQWIHRDTASHNFIIISENQYYLIDFDLASTGPVGYDWLQLATRFLPWLDWSFAALAEEPYFAPYMDQSWFLAGLLYPSDVYRDWHVSQQKKSHRSIQWFLKMHSFEKRLRFIADVRKTLG
ncbi:aminoglycoside phosphotransferase family protein [Bacillaceae bacterium SIJ1]|uniref:aminoglycoside phosphotransferase family protein n=1 Tax=Litoribacterium kuwaitense TaxID=1398745 RepID=UPI0013EA3345|nr:aminoglycoside phosphotransferase family protein [Litoribacterium kuwaitense]NGP43427.1 aminoglycoside phosphotransferase family protein [Litoribacterium kuwaitense]